MEDRSDCAVHEPRRGTHCTKLNATDGEWATETAEAATTGRDRSQKSVARGKSPSLHATDQRRALENETMIACDRCKKASGDTKRLAITTYDPNHRVRNAKRSNHGNCAKNAER